MKDSIAVYPENWISAHIYYAGDTNKFIVNGIMTFTEMLIDLNLIKSYFFIRYAEKGPHIRLRLQADATQSHDLIKSHIDEFFKDYFTKQPSIRVDPIWVKDLPITEQWHSNDSVQYIKYQPEFTRYGGTESILHVEQHFNASSALVWRILRDNINKWNYDIAIGVAIQLHLSAVFFFGLSMDDAALFFKSACKNWISLSTPRNQKIADNEVLAMFDQAYSSQKHAICEPVKELWLAMSSGTFMEQEEYQGWFEALAKFNHQLRSTKELRFFAHKTQLNYLELTERERCIWSILESCLHMTNNRLGIFNKEESYISYILMRSLTDLQLS